jgi:hypothetical protein
MADDDFAVAAGRVRSPEPASTMRLPTISASTPEGGLADDDRPSVAKMREITWEPDPPVHKPCGAGCEHWARPRRTLCSGVHSGLVSPG